MVLWRDVGEAEGDTDSGRERWKDRGRERQIAKGTDFGFELR